MKDILIVFLNYNSKDLILRAVDSVLKDLNGSQITAQIVVADNSLNTDGVKEALYDKFNGIVKYVDCGGNVGFGLGCNVGFATDVARYYAALNPDIFIPENSNTIEKIIKFMDEHPKIGIVGPKLLNEDGTLQYSCYRFDIGSILVKPFKQLNLENKYKIIKKFVDRLQMKDFDHNETTPVDWVMGSAMFARKEAIDDVGFFDDRYFMYMEDSDWCRRMWESGWAVYYLHDAVIYHGHARDSAKTPGIFRALLKNRLARIHLVSWIKYLWKWKFNFKYYAP
jgi:GT2 family glycosyltransferase